MLHIDIRKEVYRPVLKVLTRSISAIKKLDRDMPISSIAWLEVNGRLNDPRIADFRKVVLERSSELNSYRKLYWDLESDIKRNFVNYMKRSGYLPSNSKEIESLKNSLPKALIDGDERIWIYSYDQYIGNISNDVGKNKKDAPTSLDVWEEHQKRYSRRIEKLVDHANFLLPELLLLKAKISRALRKPRLSWKNIKVKKPKVQLINRPIRRFILVKKPIPISGKKRSVLRRVLKVGDNNENEKGNDII